MAFCFKETPEKKAFLWENIVFQSKAYYNFAVSVPGGLTSLRNFNQYFSQYRTSYDVKKGTQTIPGSVFQPFRGTQLLDEHNDIHLGIHYISSQYLAESSLADQLKGVENFFGIRKMDLTSDSEGSENVIEMDELNLHPCMPSLLKLLDKMKFLQSANSQSLPKWMAEFLVRLEKSKYHINCRLLIAKLVINRHNIFEPFADKFFRALAQLMCDYTQQTKIFHYFFRDVCILFLRWEATKLTTPDDEQLLSRFLNIILQMIVYPDLEVLRANLTIFKLLCERWRKIYKPELSIMNSLIGFEGDQQNINRMNRLAGLQICGILMANDIKIHMDDINMSVFYDRLI